MASFLWNLIASICALPYLILFFVVWIVASLIRPIFVLSTIAFWSQPTAALRKIELFVDTVKYLALCSEKKWKKTADPSLVFEKYKDKPELIMEQKTIIFLRHGESNWNDTFNKGDRKLMKFVQGKRVNKAADIVLYTITHRVRVKVSFLVS